MRKRWLILLALCLPAMAHGENLLGDVNTATIGPRTIVDRNLLATTAVSDTCGPVLIQGATKVMVAASWTGDSLAVVVETSIDRTNWTALIASAQYGTAATYGLYFTRVIEATMANAATAIYVPAANTGVAKYVRMRVSNNSVIGDVTSLSGWISCVY